MGRFVLVVDQSPKDVERDGLEWDKLVFDTCYEDIYAGPGNEIRLV